MSQSNQQIPKILDKSQFTTDEIIILAQHFTQNPVSSLETQSKLEKMVINNYKTMETDAFIVFISKIQDAAAENSTVTFEKELGKLFETVLEGRFEFSFKQLLIAAAQMFSTSTYFKDPSSCKAITDYINTEIYEELRNGTIEPTNIEELTLIFNLAERQILRFEKLDFKLLSTVNRIVVSNEIKNVYELDYLIIGFVRLSMVFGEQAATELATSKIFLAEDLKKTLEKFDLLQSNEQASIRKISIIIVEFVTFYLKNGDVEDYSETERIIGKLLLESMETNPEIPMIVKMSSIYLIGCYFQGMDSDFWEEGAAKYLEYIENQAIKDIYLIAKEEIGEFDDKFRENFERKLELFYGDMLNVFSQIGFIQRETLMRIIDKLDKYCVNTDFSTVIPFLVDYCFSVYLSKDEEMWDHLVEKFPKEYRLLLKKNSSRKIVMEGMAEEEKIPTLEGKRVIEDILDSTVGEDKTSVLQVLLLIFNIKVEHTREAAEMFASFIVEETGEIGNLKEFVNEIQILKGRPFMKECLSDRLEMSDKLAECLKIHGMLQ